MKEIKPPRAISESSTTSDNTSEFIDIVKRYDVVYNTHNPDYKNVEVKMKVWSQIADEIGLSVEASKRKWKNLRDSYTKYLRSFRIGTKTSKKYQYWAHADHMEFLKPYQGPGRNSVHSNGKSNDEECESECDLGFQVLAKATTSSSEEDLKINVSTNSTTSTSGLITTMANTVPNIYTTAMNAVNLAAAAAAAAAALSTPIPAAVTSATATTAPSMISPNSGGSSIGASSNCNLSTMCNLSNNSGQNAANSASAVVLPLPSLPAMSMPPPPTASSTQNQFQQQAHQLMPPHSKHALTSIPNIPTSLPLSSVSTPQIFPLAPLNATVAKGATAIPLPANSNSSSVGCLIIEPHLFASADTFKKELNAPSAAALGLFHNLTNPAAIAASLNSSAATASRTNPPLFTKIRRVQPSPQTAAINLSFSATGGGSSSSGGSGVGNSTAALGSTSSTSTLNNNQAPPPAKTRRTCERSSGSDLDVNAVLQANRDLDANTLFFLSLARQVRTMPMKFQSLAKMRCMRIVSDIELELENVECNSGGGPTDEGIGAANLKYCSIDTPPPPQQTQDGSGLGHTQIAVMNEASTEHFVYVMSPSRVESMIDISSDEEATTMNGVQ